MKKIVWLLLATLCVACSKDDSNDSPPKTPQEMVQGLWRRTHSDRSNSLVVNDIITFYRLYKINYPPTYANFTINADGTMRMFSQDNRNIMPEVEGSGTYTFTAGSLDFNLYWSRLDVRSIQRYEILLLTDSELIVKLYYAKRNDNDEFGSALPVYYRYAREWPSAEDKNFKFNIVTKKKS